MLARVFLSFSMSEHMLCRLSLTCGFPDRQISRHMFCVLYMITIVHCFCCILLSLPLFTSVHIRFSFASKQFIHLTEHLTMDSIIRHRQVSTSAAACYAINRACPSAALSPEFVALDLAPPKSPILQSCNRPTAVPETSLFEESLAAIQSAQNEASSSELPAKVEDSEERQSDCALGRKTTSTPQAPELDDTLGQRPYQSSAIAQRHSDIDCEKSPDSDQFDHRPAHSRSRGDSLLSNATAITCSYSPINRRNTSPTSLNNQKPKTKMPRGRSQMPKWLVETLKYSNSTLLRGSAYCDVRREAQEELKLSTRELAFDSDELPSSIMAQEFRSEMAEGDGLFCESFDDLPPIDDGSDSNVKPLTCRSSAGSKLTHYQAAVEELALSQEALSALPAQGLPSSQNLSFQPAQSASQPTARPQIVVPPPQGWLHLPGGQINQGLPFFQYRVPTDQGIATVYNGSPLLPNTQPSSVTSVAREAPQMPRQAHQPPPQQLRRTLLQPVRQVMQQQFQTPVHPRSLPMTHSNSADSGYSTQSAGNSPNTWSAQPALNHLAVQPMQGQVNVTGQAMHQGPGPIPQTLPTVTDGRLAGQAMHHRAGPIVRTPVDAWSEHHLQINHHSRLIQNGFAPGQILHHAPQQAPHGFFPNMHPQMQHTGHLAPMGPVRMRGQMLGQPAPQLNVQPPTPSLAGAQLPIMPPTPTLAHAQLPTMPPNFGEFVHYTTRQ